MTNKFIVDGVPTIRIENPAETKKYRLIDVRRPEEFSGELGHIEGAELATLGPELEKFLQSADKKEDILFICRSGARSANATNLARQLGFDSVYNMEGGMLMWNSAGFEIKK